MPLSGLGLLVALILLIWLASGFYIVDQGRRGIVLTFGRLSEETIRRKPYFPRFTRLIVDSPWHSRNRKGCWMLSLLSINLDAC